MKMLDVCCGEGSSRELRPNLVIDGRALGLKLKRLRYFYVSTLQKPIRLLSSAVTSQKMHGQAITRHETAILMGLQDFIPERQLNRITQGGMEQGIPPVMTKYIAELMFPDKFFIG